MIALMDFGLPSVNFRDKPIVSVQHAVVDVGHGPASGHVTRDSGSPKRARSDQVRSVP